MIATLSDRGKWGSHRLLTVGHGVSLRVIVIRSIDDAITRRTLVKNELRDATRALFIAFDRLDILMMLVLSSRSLLTACVSILAGRPSHKAWNCDASSSRTALFCMGLYVQASCTSINAWPLVAIRLLLTIEAY